MTFYTCSTHVSYTSIQIPLFDDVELEIGPYLGELTNELASPDDYIIEFVSGGPKNYAFRTIQGEQICRIRGFSLNYQIAQILNFHSMLDIVTTDQSKTLTVTNPSKITRSKFRD